MIVEIIVLTAFIELITIIGRVFLGSVKSFYKKNPLPVRVHHGYIGLGFIISYFVFSNEFYAILGFALLFSDIIHHVGLYYFTGSSEFP
jgi:hypothetical protein